MQIGSAVFLRDTNGRRCAVAEVVSEEGLDIGRNPAYRVCLVTPLIRWSWVGCGRVAAEGTEHVWPVARIVPCVLG